MCMFVYIYVNFTRWVYLYIEGCLAGNTVSKNDLIRRKVVCVLLRVTNTCVQVLVTRRRNLPFCNAASQPTALPRSPLKG